jgi:hypothetical protein
MKIHQIIKNSTKYSVNLKFYTHNNIFLGKTNYSIHSQKCVSLNNLYISPKFRKQGFGKKILDLTESEIIKDNTFQLKQINLVAHEVNNKDGCLIDFFQNHGYFRLTQQSFYTFDDGIYTYNLIPMTKFFK